ncbi:carbohydrate kinase family protein [Kallotenue papyrolyticum]|uniref:carbohydrate kinase family protein n=1 Tax=Kallotenue papyrolyticum TaxID=1325125 RepID=UPI0004BBE2EE|nr:carbohydrate kinase family protein [Kallotenue papyrolyticum]
MTQQPSIVVIGGSSLDIKGRLRRAFLPGTSNAAAIQISIGGVGRNIAENLARLGTSVALISAVCADDFGRAIIQHTEAAGVDVSHMLTTCEHRSASYIAIVSPDGSLLAGLDDSAAGRAITPDYIRARADLLQRADMVVMDANVARVTADAILEICEAAGVPVALEPVAVGLAQRFSQTVGRFFLVTPNELEAEALTGLPVRDVTTATLAAQRLVALGVDVAVITLAQEGVVYASSNEVGHVPAQRVDVVDPTGAGAALAATIIYGLTHNIPLAETIQLGQIAAALTLQSPETVAPELSLEYLYAQLEL